MRVVFFGSGNFGIPTFRSLRSDGHEIVGVVAQPDRPAGRGQALRMTPLKEFAVSEGFEVLTPENVNDAAVVAQLAELHADLGYVAAFGQKIGPALLTMFPVALINLHGSLLPAYRGAAPVQWAILNHERETGVTIFRLVEQMDAGPILAQRRTLIGDEETSEHLAARLSRIGCDCLHAALDRLAANPRDPGDSQDASRVSHARKLKKSDGTVDFNQPAQLVARRINGLSPWPGAAANFVSAHGRPAEPVTLLQAMPVEAEAHGESSPGAITPRGAIQTGQGEIAILEIRPANGRAMGWESFVNGRHVQPGDRFAPAETAPRG